MNFKRDFYQRSSSFFSSNISTRDRLDSHLLRGTKENRISTQLFRAFIMGSRIHFYFFFFSDIDFSIVVLHA